MDIRLAELNIRWPDEYRDFVRGFGVNEENAQTYALSLSIEKKMTECHGFSFSEKPSSRVLQRQLQNEVLCADDKWTDVTVYCPHYSDPNFTLPIAAICSRLSFFSTALIHGSFVEHNGEGVIFTGYSGIGKTTQAELWNKFLGADIINGDKVLIKADSNGAAAYGLPWKGSSPYCKNKKAPIKGIVVLRQSSDNKIRKLDASEFMEYFMPHIFLPHWDEYCMSMALETVDLILREVPLWLLECKPDEEAVKLTEKTVFRK